MEIGSSIQSYVGWVYHQNIRFIQNIPDNKILQDDFYYAETGSRTQIVPQRQLMATLECYFCLSELKFGITFQTLYVIFLTAASCC